MRTYIYALIDPRDGQMKYIGKANNPQRRYKDHLTDFRTEWQKALWIRQLKALKLKPELEILDEVNLIGWEFWEMWYIAYFRSIGVNLLNVKPGGNGLTSANYNSFGNPGRKIKKAA
jgi:hypothetical protein